MRSQKGDRTKGETTVNKLTIKTIDNAGYRVNSFTKAFVAAMAVCTVLATTASACAPKSGSTSNLGVASPAIQAILAKAHGRLALEAEIAPGIPQGEASIVGMWTSSLVVDGQVVDFGFEQWTSDGLQVLNDMSPLLAGNICYGTWTKTGPYAYKLNHPTFLYDTAGVNVIGIGYIRATITLDKSGKSYTGVSTFDSYDLAGNILAPQSSGDLVGQRINVDTTLGPLAMGPIMRNGNPVVAARTSVGEPNRKADADAEGSNE
jgi:hypothetical protein